MDLNSDALLDAVTTAAGRCLPRQGAVDGLDTPLDSKCLAESCHRPSLQRSLLAGRAKTDATLALYATNAALSASETRSRAPSTQSLRSSPPQQRPGPRCPGCSWWQPRPPARRRPCWRDLWSASSATMLLPCAATCPSVVAGPQPLLGASRRQRAAVQL